MAPKDTEVDELTTSNRKAAFAMLIGSAENGALKWGMKSKVATFFEVAPSTIGKLYDSTMGKIEFYYSVNNMFEEQLNLLELKVP
jgi:hypothetical protein